MVVDDVRSATGLALSGERVVLIVPEGTDCGELPQEPGRIAVMFGDPTDPATRDAAAAMDAELFHDSA